MCSPAGTTNTPQAQVAAAQGGGHQEEDALRSRAHDANALRSCERGASTWGSRAHEADALRSVKMMCTQRDFVYIMDATWRAAQ